MLRQRGGRVGEREKGGERERESAYTSAQKRKGKREERDRSHCDAEEPIFWAAWRDAVRYGAMPRDYHNNRRYYSVGGSERRGWRGEEIPLAVAVAVETDWLGSDALLMGSGDHLGKMDEPTIV